MGTGVPHLSLNFLGFLEILSLCLYLQLLFQKFWVSFLMLLFQRNSRSGSLGPVDPISGLLIFSGCSGSGSGWKLSLASWTYQGEWAPGTRGPLQPSTGAGRSASSLPGCSVSEILAISSRSVFCYTTQSHLFQIISVSVWEQMTDCITCLYF